MTTNIEPTTPAGPEDPYRGEIPPTSWAQKYQSRYTKTFEPNTSLLGHLNCGYLSTPATPPTLLALKQHAQSLVILIKNISVSTEFCLVDGKNRVRGHSAPGKYRENEAFDFLTDLSKPYQNEDEWHQKPLTELLNEISWETNQHETAHQCPLADSKLVGVGTDGTKSRPYCNHQTLARHANDCLEILDHEYSATGGLMSLLPTDDKREKWQMDLAENCILGQWLLYNQHLVARTHELELAYGNALDTIKSEAVVPLQTISKAASGNNTISAEGAGREIGYPQDRWVLANAGDDVYQYVHKVLDRQEALIEPKEKAWKEAGVMGERMWRTQRGGELYAAGLVAWDVTTRYIRLRGKPRSPIFILPAHGEHPGVAATREAEKRPTVVSIPAPQWPTRVTNLERKQQEAVAAAKKHELSELELRHANIQLASKSRKTSEEYETLRRVAERLEVELALRSGKEVKDLPALLKARLEDDRLVRVRNSVLEETWYKALEEVLPHKYHKKMEKMHKRVLAEKVQQVMDEDDAEKEKERAAEEGYDYEEEQEEGDSTPVRMDVDHASVVDTNADSDEGSDLFDSDSDDVEDSS